MPRNTWVSGRGTRSPDGRVTNVAILREEMGVCRKIGNEQGVLVVPKENVTIESVSRANFLTVSYVPFYVDLFA